MTNGRWSELPIGSARFQDVSAEQLLSRGAEDAIATSDSTGSSGRAIIKDV